MPIPKAASAWIMKNTSVAKSFVQSNFRKGYSVADPWLSSRGMGAGNMKRWAAMGAGAGALYGSANDRNRLRGAAIGAAGGSLMGMGGLTAFRNRAAIKGAAKGYAGKAMGYGRNLYSSLMSKMGR
jgi:hypothetical protein